MLPFYIPRRASRPRHPLDLVQDRFSRVMEQFPGDTVTSYCPTDVEETDDAFLVEAELPGFKKEEIELTVEKDVLRIRAERPRSEKRNKRLNERTCFEVDRVIELSSAVEEDNISASFQDGVLAVRLPKNSDRNLSKIQIE